MKFVSILVLTVGAYVASADDHGWSYEGASGPDYWGDLNLGGKNQCGMQRQSPIDIEVGKARHNENMAPLRLQNYERPLPNATAVNNGHSIQVNAAEQQILSGGPLTGTYTLLQMHFHWGKDSYRGSEHTVNGKRYPIELHFVHKQAQPASGQLAVIGVFFDLTKGESSPGIQKIAQVIKGLKTHENVPLQSALSPSELLPSTRDFFTYQGSLTTPPCSEIVQWLVLREPLKINEKDLDAFRSTLFENGKPMVDNFRPVLPLGERQVTTSFPTSSSSSGQSSAMMSSMLLTLISTLLCSQ